MWKLTVGRNEEAGVIKVTPAFVGSLATLGLPLSSIDEYPKRFSLEERISLVEAGLDPDTTQDYPVTASAKTCIEYHTQDITPQYIRETGIESVRDLITAKKWNIPETHVRSLVDKCAPYFTEIMEKAEGDWEKVLEYNPDHKSYELQELVEKRVPPTEANKYTGRAAYEICSLREANIDAETANAYVASAHHVIEYKRAGIHAETANSFGRKVPPEDVAFFVKEGIAGAAVVPFYEERAKVWYSSYLAFSLDIKHIDIAKLIKMDCTAERVAAYPENVYVEEILRFIESGVEPDDSGIVAFEEKIKQFTRQNSWGKHRSNYREYRQPYSAELDGKTIAALMGMGVVIFDAYNSSEGGSRTYTIEDCALKRFGKKGIETLVAHGIMPRGTGSSGLRGALRYPTELEVDEIIALNKAGISEDDFSYESDSRRVPTFNRTKKWNDVDDRFTPKELAAIAKTGRDPRFLYGYARTNITDILALSEKGITAEVDKAYSRPKKALPVTEIKANGYKAYDHNFSREVLPVGEVIALHEKGITPNVQKTYGNISTAQVIALYDNGLTHSSMRVAQAVHMSVDSLCSLAKYIPPFLVKKVEAFGTYLEGRDIEEEIVKRVKRRLENPSEYKAQMFWYPKEMEKIRTSVVKQMEREKEST